MPGAGTVIGRKADVGAWTTASTGLAVPRPKYMRRIKYLGELARLHGIEGKSVV